MAGTHVKKKKEKLECKQILFVGPEGSALSMLLTERQSELFDDNDSWPHIAVAVTPGHEPRELGKMVARCQKLRASNEGSKTQKVTTLGCELYMINMPARIELPDSTFITQQPPLVTEYGPPSELAEVPSILWARHKNHVGFVNSAPPHLVTLKPNVKLPMIRQYNLSHKAIAGIEGVICYTNSPCNTPILPIPKPGRPDEWRFLQD